MIGGKKGQFLIFSAMFLLIMLIFIYSIETENSYIVNSSKFNLLDNIIYEVCYIGKNSNGSYINQRYNDFAQDISTYCSKYGYNCSLEIINNTVIPPLGNWSLLNYTHYDYFVNYEFEGFVYNGDFTC